MQWRGSVDADLQCPGEKMQKKQWDPASFLGSPSHGSANSRETAVIIINTSIARADVFEAIWANGAAPPARSSFPLSLA